MATAGKRLFNSLSVVCMGSTLALQFHASKQRSSRKAFKSCPSSWHIVKQDYTNIFLWCTVISRCMAVLVPFGFDEFERVTLKCIQMLPLELLISEKALACCWREGAFPLNNSRCSKGAPSGHIIIKQIGVKTDWTIKGLRCLDESKKGLVKISY